VTVNGIVVPDEQIAEFCKRWNVTKLELFGSVLRQDFQPGSDIDVLATFSPRAKRTLLDEAQMEMDLEAMLNRAVHLVSRTAVENSHNPIRRRHILESAVTIYGE